ncbi:MAG: CpsD/CapB family tyrosine-protein kinase [Clostridia bacterium]|nr:CpsD/CapB family tyrosine-protein kinase [Clostridia bacterium]
MFKVFNKKRKKIDITNEPRKDLLIDKSFDATEIEAYKTIRTSLYFSLVHHAGCKRLLMASSVSKEGKTTVCVNLAKTVAQTDSKVLIIDCDLRKPRIHRFFKSKSIPGLTNYLIGQSSLDEIIKNTDTPNLSVIYSGLIPPNPAEVLASTEFKLLIEELSKKYDYIFFDCAPLLEVSDALEVSKFVDGVILMARQNYTSHNFINQTLKKLEFANIKVFGFILNDMPKKKNRYYYRYIT